MPTAGDSSCTFPSYEPFAITANQVAYLTEHGYIDMPTITRREIRDQAGEAAGQGFTDTPLDFIEQNIYWSRKAHEPFLQFVLKFGFQTFPIDSTCVIFFSSA